MTYRYTGEAGSSIIAVGSHFLKSQDLVALEVSGFSQSNKISLFRYNL